MADTASNGLSLKDRGALKINESRWSALDSSSSLTVKGSKVSHGSGTKVAFFSLAGGVGKTTIAASLARILAVRSLQMVLVNCSYGFALEQYLSQRSPRFGALCFWQVPSGSTGVPVTVIDACPFDQSGRHIEDQGGALIEQATKHADMVLFDLSTGGGPPGMDVLSAVDHIVIPLAPDLQSVSSLSSLESLLQAPRGSGPGVHYLLNRYDDSRLFHREVRNRLENELGPGLLPVAVREESLIQEATANGVTIVDHAPGASVVNELTEVADWLTALSPQSASAAEMKPGAAA